MTWPTIKRPFGVVASASILALQSLLIVGFSLRHEWWHGAWIIGTVSLGSTLVGLAIVALIWRGQPYIRWLLVPLALWGLPEAVVRLTTTDPLIAPVESIQGFYMNGYQPISKVISVLAVALLFTPRSHKWFLTRGGRGSA